MGRLTAQKGPEVFLRAAALIAKRRQDVRFLVCGEGDQAAFCRELADELGIAERVRFTGFVERSELGEVFARADAFVLPSISEPFGLTPLEALACGVPAIVSRDSGVAEVLPSSLKFDPADITGLANRVLAVLAHPALRDHLVELGTRELRGLRWEASAESLQLLYSEVCA